MLARESVVADQPLLVHAQRKHRGGALLQAVSRRPRLPGGVEDRGEVRAVDLARSHVAELRARHGNVEQLVEAVAIRAELAETAVAGQVGDPLGSP